jgi:putative SOS response-associated peptidase YedK
MCYYNGVRVTKAEFIRLKQLEKAIANLNILQNPLYTGFDYSPHPVIKRTADKAIDFEITEMEWGFLPAPNKWPFIRTREDAMRMRHGYKDEQGKFHTPITTLNAVSEELLQNGKMYRDAALHRRCLVLSTGFFEWRHVNRLNKRTGAPLKTTEKYPYHITLKGREYFYMAGIWTPWTDEATGEHVETFAIITTAANPLMEQIHNSKKRMPTILNDDLAYDWLFGDLSEERITEIARTQFPAEQMEAYTIAKNFREEPDPTQPFTYEDLPALEAA